MAYYDCRCPSLPKPKNTLVKSNTCVSYKHTKNIICSVCHHCSGKCLDSNLSNLYLSRSVFLHSHISFAPVCTSLNLNSYYFQDDFSQCCLRNETEVKSTKLNNNSLSSTLERAIQQLSKEIDIGNLLLKFLQGSTSESIKDDHSLLNKTEHPDKPLNIEDVVGTSIKPEENVNKPNISFQNTDAKNYIGESYSCGNAAPCCFENVLDRKLPTLEYEGLACRTNKTLSFYILDDKSHAYILNNMIGVLAQPSLMIVDLEAEEHFNLKEYMSYNNIGKSICLLVLFY